MQAGTSMLVVFDVDGTLCDTEAVDDDCFARVCAERLGLHALPAWSDFAEVTGGAILTELWRRVHGRPPSAEESAGFAEREAQVFEQELARAPQRFAAVAGAGPLLARLGPRHAIATGGWRRSAELKLAAAGLPAEGLLATAEDSAERVRLFALARERGEARLGERCARVALVGDGLWDARVAATLGWSFVGVGRGARAARLREAGAVVVASDLREPELLAPLGLAA